MTMMEARRNRVGHLMVGTCVVALAVSSAGMCAAPAADKNPSTVVHVVKPDEWVWRIARIYHVNPYAIIQYDHMTPPYLIRPGQELTIPLGDLAVQQTRLWVINWRKRQAENAAAPDAPAKGPVTAAASAPPAKPSPAAAPAPPSAPAAPARPPVAPVLPANAPTPAATPAVAAFKPGSTVHIILSVKDGKRYVGDILSTISPDGSVAADTPQLLDLLKHLLKSESFAAASGALGAAKQTPLPELAKAGIQARYDGAQLQIVLDIPPEARPLQELQVADLDREIVGEVATPAAFSGYLNLRGSVDYVEHGSKTGLHQPLVLADGAARALGLVLESEAQFAPDQQGSKFSRDGTRLVFDSDSTMTRWTLGDLRVQTDGFQGSRDMVGLSVLRLYDQLAPQLNVRPRGNRSFTLTQASTVQTFINGQPVQQVRLDPGTYSAANFPFVEGANDVHLVIINDSGAVENLDFSIFFARSLLRPGLSEFGAFAGFASDLVNSGISYPHPKPVFTGFFRHGLSDSFTGGANFQADSRVQMGGLTSLWASPIGTIGFDVAGSRNEYVGNGYAVNLGFERLYQDTGNFQSRSLSASFELRSKNFSVIGENNNLPVVDPSRVQLNNPYRYQAAITYSQSFGEYTFAQIDARYAKAFDHGKDVGTIRGSVGYGFNTNFNVNLSLQYATGGVDRGLSAGIQLTYRFNDRSNIRADYQTHDNMRRLSYQNSQGRGTGAWSVSGDLEEMPGSVNFNGSGDYAANRVQLGAAQMASYDMHGSGVTDMRSSVRVGTSLAFADGAVGIGRPIFDSFAVFRTHPSLGDADVVVEPSPEGALAHSDTLGPAVLSDLGSHALRTVSYDVPEAPPGYDIGSGSLRAMPPYRSGYEILVGSDYSLMLWGRLLDSKGEPISLLAGRAVELAPNGKTVTLFTSRDGRFSAQGLRPGHWRIEMPTEPPVTYDLVVVKGQTSLVSVGDLKPSAEEPK